MARNRNRNKPSNNGNAPTQQNMTREERTKQKEELDAKKMERKLKLAADDNYGLVSRKATVTNEGIVLLTKNDWLLNKLIQLAPSMTHKIDPARFLKIIATHQQNLKNWDLENAEISDMLGIEFESFGETQNTRQKKQQATKPPTTPAVPSQTKQQTAKPKEQQKKPETDTIPTQPPKTESTQSIDIDSILGDI